MKDLIILKVSGGLMYLELIFDIYSVKIVLIQDFYNYELVLWFRFKELTSVTCVWVNVQNQKITLRFLLYTLCSGQKKHELML